MLNVKLRRAVAADLPDIEAIVRAAYAPWIDIIGAKPGPMLDDYASLIAKEQVTVLHATRIEAVLVLIPLDDALLLDNVAVAPDAQGKGHSRRLMNWAESQAIDFGYDLIRLYTHEKMQSNRDYYWRLGYRPYRKVVEQGLPRVYMEKWLSRRDP